MGWGMMRWVLWRVGEVGGQGVARVYSLESIGVSSPVCDISGT